MTTCDDWHGALPWDELPKTFQNAIALTQRLGERFLWIDSLCIVQDDPADVAAQIQLMGVIFEGSYCTIAAVDAKGVDGLLPVDRGLFLSGPANIARATLQLKLGMPGSLPRSNEPANVHKARLWMEEEKHRITPNEAYGVVLQQSGQVGPFSAWFENRGWNSRGWVFQERQLSRRCIFFTEECLGWRCNEYWETEWTGVPERRDARTKFDLETATTEGGYTYKAHDNVRTVWQAAVEDYSQTKLTYISDKDKALKGLEERLDARFGAAFHFGILDFRPAKEVLHRQLLWMPTTSRGSTLNNRSDFSCPTWSWMIIDGPVRWSPTVLLTNPEMTCRIKFGQIESQMKALYISGPSQPIKLGEPFSNDLDRSSGRDKRFSGVHISWLDTVDAGTNRIMSETGEKMIGWVMLDTADEPGQLIAVPLLQYLRLDDEEEPMCLDFLALTNISGQNGLPFSGRQNLYRRVGRGRVIKDAYTWLVKCKPLDLVVV